jgi:uncharacterized BrkB/YihY/UPF0761 family membrane protein
MALPIGAIWFAVLLTSLFAPDLVAGADSAHFKVVALVNWLWGGVATAFILRATLFNPDPTIDWDDSPALIWIGAAVALIWVVVTVISFAGPEVVYDTWRIPVAAMAAPAVGVIITKYATEFLVSGFSGLESAGGTD